MPAIWPQTFQPPSVKAQKLFPNHKKQQGTLLFVKPDRYVLFFYEDSYHVKVNSITTFQFEGLPPPRNPLHRTFFEFEGLPPPRSPRACGAPTLYIF